MNEDTNSSDLNDGPVEALRFVADLIEFGTNEKVHVLFFADFFRSLADEIELLLEDSINIISTNGEEIAVIKGQEATTIIRLAVEDYITKVLLRDLRESTLLKEGKQH